MIRFGDVVEFIVDVDNLATIRKKYKKSRTHRRGQAIEKYACGGRARVGQKGLVVKTHTDGTCEVIMRKRYVNSEWRHLNVNKKTIRPIEKQTN